MTSVLPSVPVTIARAWFRQGQWGCHCAWQERMTGGQMPEMRSVGITLGQRPRRRVRAARRGLDPIPPPNRRDETIQDTVDPGLLVSECTVTACVSRASFGDAVSTQLRSSGRACRRSRSRSRSKPPASRQASACRDDLRCPAVLSASNGPAGRSWCRRSWCRGSPPETRSSRPVSRRPAPCRAQAPANPPCHQPPRVGAPQRILEDPG